jgi:RNA polymerase primary sigma factor
MLKNLETAPEWEEALCDDCPGEKGLYRDGERDSEEKDNAVIQYLREIARHPLLTPGEEIRLARQIKDCQENLIFLFLELPIPLREIDELRRRSRIEGQSRDKFTRSDTDLLERILLRIREIDAESTVDRRTKRLLNQIHQVEWRLRKAFATMVESNQRLVVSVSRHHLNKGLPLLDLIQEGNIGLMKAVLRFDPARRHRFSTYAVWWIRQAMHRAIQENGRTIRMPAHIIEALNRYRLLMASTKKPENLLPELIIREARLSRGQWEIVRKHNGEAVSLETPKRDGGRRMIDLLSDRKTPSPSEVAMQRELSERLRNTLTKLSAKQETVIKQRFGIDCGGDHTLGEIGGQLGISRERVRQIEMKALERLKETTLGRELKRLWDAYR